MHGDPADVAAITQFDLAGVHAETKHDFERRTGAHDPDSRIDRVVRRIEDGHVTVARLFHEPAAAALHACGDVPIDVVEHGAPTSVAPVRRETCRFHDVAEQDG